MEHEAAQSRALADAVRALPGLAAQPRWVLARLPTDLGMLQMLASGTLTVEEWLHNLAVVAAESPRFDAAVAADHAFAVREQARLDAAEAKLRADMEALQAEYDAKDALEAAEHQRLEDEEMRLLASHLKALEVGAQPDDGGPGGSARAVVESAAPHVPLQFTQWVRLPPAAGGTHSRVTWRWASDAWEADQRPAHGRNYLQIAFISDTHGAQGMLDDYRSLPAVAEADVLCICGDVLEHERGPSLQAEFAPHLERDFAKWLLAQPQQYKLMVAGNHDAACADGEDAALHGSRAPAAGAAPRAHLEARGGPCMYLQDEAAVITLANGERITFYGTPWCAAAFALRVRS